MPIDNLSNKDIERGLWYLRNKKKIKKIIIIFLFVLIFCLYGFSLFRFILIKIADKRDANNEWVSINFDYNKSTPVDLVVVNKDILTNDTGGYDVVVSIQNPNEGYFVQELKYKFLYRDGESEEKQAFILPLETKRLIDLNVKSESIIDNVDLKIISIGWKKLKSTELNFPKDIFIFENQLTHFSENEKSLRNWVESDILNQSPYNFKNVNIYFLVYSGEKLEAIKQSSISNFYSGDKKHLETSWFYKIPSYANLVVESDTNVFDKNNYISNK